MTFVPFLAQEKNKKYFRRGELAEKEREEYLEKYGHKKDSVKSDVADHLEDSVADNGQEHLALSRPEVIRRLRERGEPILLYGETELEAFRRLRKREILEPEVNKVIKKTENNNQTLTKLHPLFSSGF